MRCAVLILGLSCVSTPAFGQAAPEADSPEADSPEEGQTADRQSALTAAATDNQYEPRDWSAPAPPSLEPDADGRYPLTVRGAFGRGLSFGAIDDAFAVQLRGRAQLQLAGSDTEIDGFGIAARIRRLRVVFGGHALRHLVTFYIQLGFADSDLERDRPVPLRDAFATIHLHPSFNLRVGQMKVPFDRQRVTSSSRLQLVDRARLVRLLNLDRDIGLQLYSTDLFGLGGYVSYQLGIFAGEGRNRFIPDEGLLYVGRIQVSPTGRFADFSESDLEGGDPRVAVALGAAYNHRAQRTESTQGSFFPAGSADVLHLTGDIFLKAYGASLLVEALYREARNSRTSVPTSSGWGLVAQAGYVLPLQTTSQRFEVAGRLAHIWPLGDQTSVVASTEVTAGLSWFVLDHDLKAQLDYGVFLSDLPTEHLGRLQLQLFF